MSFVSQRPDNNRSGLTSIFLMSDKTFAYLGYVLIVMLFCFAVFPEATSSGVSKGALAGIILGSVAAAVTLTAIIAIIIMRKRIKGYTAVARRKRCKHFLVGADIFSK